MTIKIFVRPIELQDNQGVASLIRTVMPEFGATGPGFAIHDSEVDEMYQTYNLPNSAYFVVTDGFVIFGGGGISPLMGGDTSVCELRKMYFKPEIRSLGLGQQVMDLCLEAARENGFKKCYLETLNLMEKAQQLYLRNGFEPLTGPLGDTGHFACDSWYIKNL